jgi:Arc/MetJ-type ribon-helix-helix transcriptional regulator
MTSKVMEIRKEILLNTQTKNKLKELVEKYNGDYPNESQCIRSAIHFLHNERVVKHKFKSRLLQ